MAKALSQDFSVMIMDEPTAALNSAEVDRLFEIIAELRERGVAVLYVSHRLSEIFRIADRVTVLRDGRRVDTKPIGGLTRARRHHHDARPRAGGPRGPQGSAPPRRQPALAVTRPHGTGAGLAR